MNELHQSIVSTLKALRHDLRELTHLQKTLDELESLLATLSGSEEHLRAEIERTQALISDWHEFFMRSPDLLCIADSKGYFRRVNPSLARTLGYRSSDLIDHKLIDFVHEDDRAVTLRELQKLNNGQDTICFENRYRCKDGKRYLWFNWTCPAALPSSGFIYAVARDITETKRSSDEILFLAQHDSLTGLRNRASFRQELIHACERVKRSSRYEVGLLFIDLNGFKAINDTHGHAVGDLVLSIVADRLRQISRSTDLVARIGGDEFTMLIQGAASHTEQIVQRIHQSLAAPIDLRGGRTVNVSASIGVARSNELNNDADSLLNAADQAMYVMKATAQSNAHSAQSAKRQALHK